MIISHKLLEFSITVGLGNAIPSMWKQSSKVDASLCSSNTFAREVPSGIT